MIIEPVGCELTSKTDDAGVVTEGYAHRVGVVIWVNVADVKDGSWASNDVKRKGHTDAITAEMLICIDADEKAKAEEGG
tara:strand:+ start:926 stop:1162 length:237 start_codon:yes stop_codon:yes gene_type:complete